MNLRNFILILTASFFAILLRFYIDNNIITSIIGSFVFGYAIEKRLNKLNSEILITGFCSSFTSFSGFMYVLHKVIVEKDFLEILFYVNIILIINLLFMSFGFQLSRKIM